MESGQEIEINSKENQWYYRYSKTFSLEPRKIQKYKINHPDIWKIRIPTGKTYLFLQP